MNQKSDLAIAERFLLDNPDIEVIEVLLVDLNGVHWGKWIPRSKVESVFTGGRRLAILAGRAGWEQSIRCAVSELLSLNPG